MHVARVDSIYLSIEPEAFKKKKLEKCVTFFVKLITFLVKVPGTLPSS